MLILHLLSQRMSFFLVAFISVQYIEGTAVRLIEDGGVVVGVEYREKDTENLKVIS